MEPYELELLPLDTPDDDPRWAAYLDLFAIVFLEGRAPEDGVAAFRRHRRADGATLGMVTAEGPGLDGRHVVAGLAWAPIRANTGGNIVPVMAINTVAVRPTHRRRGLMRMMMDHHLRRARAEGFTLAALSASEATIYGRFGFGVASRCVEWEIDTQRFAIRPEVAIAPGSLEFANPPLDENIFERLSAAHQAAHRGAFSPLGMHLAKADGTWDFDEQGPSKKLRYLLHFDASGAPDGFAEFKHGSFVSKYSESPAPTAVLSVCSSSPEVERALWQGLASFDLVEKLTYESAGLDDPLPGSLIDPWAIKQNAIRDGIWLRILDLEKAVADRGFESDGHVVIKVADSMGFCEGTWCIAVREGQGEAVRTSLSPAVELGVDSLARLWFGDVTAVQLARSGLIHGSPGSVQKLSRLFATACRPVNLNDF